MSCKIYKIVDNTNGNVYVGSTKNLINRIGTHKYYYKRRLEYKYKCSSQLILINENWYYEIIEECDLNNRKERERYYINNTPNCINHFKLNGRIIDEKRKNYVDNYQKEYHKYTRSWGGDKRHNNNLLAIDVNLFK